MYPPLVMQSKQAFYDSYHQKNDKYIKVIRENNFTYFYIQRTLQSDCIKASNFAIKVLDVGCGVGTLCLYLASKGAKTKGVDVSERAITIAKHAAKTLQLKNVEFVKKQLWSGKADFDLVICSEVIEHVEDDQRLLKDIKDKLKKRGRLLLTTPSKNNFLYRVGYYKKFDQEVGHLRRYTPEILRALFEKAGLKITRIQQKEGILRNILFTTKLGFLIRFIKGPLIPIFHLIDECTIPLFGAADILVVAEKK
jgi:SAM-dependent methyltransferase